MSEMMEDNSSSPSDGGENPWQKMANEALAERQQAESSTNNPESIEKSFFEAETEFTPDQIKEFREKLLNADEEQAEAILKSRIAFLEDSCDKVDIISTSLTEQHIHRGYIGSDTKVVFQSGFGSTIGGSHYKLKDTGYLHEAVSFLRNNKESIKDGRQLFTGINGFLNSYFGIPNGVAGNDREDVIWPKTGLSNSELSDNEYFDIIENIDISVLKGEHTAECSERTAMAQNILSLLGYETYFVLGNVSVDDKNEGHAFNVIADSVGQKGILDFSITSTLEYRGTNWSIPTMLKIPDDFLQGGKAKVSTFEGHIDENGKVNKKRANDIEYEANKIPKTMYQNQ